MATRLVVGVQSPGGDGSHEFFVDEDFDEACERIQPLHPPTTDLERRGACIWTKTNGNRLLLNPNLIVWAEEDHEEDDEDE